MQFYNYDKLTSDQLFGTYFVNKKVIQTMKEYKWINIYGSCEKTKFNVKMIILDRS